jgi:hypothetical protein
MHCTQVWAVGDTSVWACTNATSPSEGPAELALLPLDNTNQFNYTDHNKSIDNHSVSNTTVSNISIPQKKCFHFCSYLSNGSYTTNVTFENVNENITVNETFRTENITFQAMADNVSNGHSTETSQNVFAPSPSLRLRTHVFNTTLGSTHHNNSGDVSIIQCECDDVPDFAPFHVFWILFVLIAAVIAGRRALNRRNKVTSAETQTNIIPGTQGILNPTFNQHH